MSETAEGPKTEDKAKREVSLSEAADLIGLSRQTLKVQIHNGRIPAVKRWSQWFVTIGDLTEYGRQVRRPVKKGRTRAKRAPRRLVPPVPGRGERQHLVAAP